jgi:DNA polymerase, archaea type
MKMSSIISTKTNFNKENIRILSVDFETRQITIKKGSNYNTRTQIFAAGFYTNTGFKEAIHLLSDSKFKNDEVKFIRYIVYRLQSFQGIITGWHIAGSDLIILDEVCKRIGVESPVGFYETIVTNADESEDSTADDHEDVKDDRDNSVISKNNDDELSISYPYLKDKKLIDMYRVFHHGFIKNSVYPFKYRDLQLDTVAMGMLGYGKYVSESTGIKITGENVLQFPADEQKKYVLKDAELVIRLIEHNNYEVFNILRCIAEISGLEFRQVCHAGVGKAWESIIYKMIRTGQCSTPTISGRLKKKKYSGAIVLEPEPKSYDTTTPIEIFDVKGLYPTIMMLHNLSFETVCCECCRDNPNTRISQQIMDVINDGLQKKLKSKAAYEIEKRNDRYWICLKNKGAIPKMLLKFKEQREYYRNKGNESMSQSLKVMMNSIYGLFGSENIFAFQDYRVAELVTAFSRLVLLDMKKLANNQFGMNIIYGDTDSIFVASDMKEPNSIRCFIETCKRNLDVDVEHQNTFVRSILLGKKHYIGIQPNGNVIIRGMEGKKRDKPKFFNQVFSQLIENYKNINNEDLIINILNAFQRLEAAEVDPSLLAYSSVLRKNPDGYQPYTAQYKIGNILNKESGSLISYYKSGQQEDGYKGYSTNYQDLNIDVYKQELWKVVKDILRLLHYNIQKLEYQIFPEMITEEKDDIIMIPMRNNTGSHTRKKYHTGKPEANVKQQDESLTNYYFQ